jgi:hypothetical protein
MTAQPAFGGGEASGLLSPGRSPLQHLLHALNQPLTGLHCSLELALVGQRTPEQYVRALSDGLALAGRMSVLMAAIRELVETEEVREEEKPTANGPGAENRPVIALDALLHETADELRPAAEARKKQILVQCEAPLPVRATRPRLASAVFRFLDSTLSLTRPGGDLRIRARSESGQARLEVLWDAGHEADHPPFSPPQLGLLIAEAAWKRLGGEWLHQQSREQPGDQSGEKFRCVHIISARLPLAGARHDLSAQLCGGTR